MGRNGYVYMINNIKFEKPIDGSSKKLMDRHGSDEDEEKIKEFFKDTIFWENVYVHNNLKVEDMRKKIQMLSKTDFTDHGALFLFLSSHGNGKGLAGTDTMIKKNGNASPLLDIKKDILSLFIRDNEDCKTLIGKPKFFIFEACRGESKQTVLPENDEEQSTDEIDFSPFYRNYDDEGNDEESYKDHNESNFFVWYAAVEGEKSFLNIEKGSYFLQALMETFKEYHRTKSVPQMVAIVNNKMNEMSSERSKGTRISQWVSSPIVEPYFTGIL